MTGSAPTRRRLATLVAAALLTTSCGDVSEQVLPSCDDPSRLAILAQSVPEAAYVPCVATLPPGWSFAGLHVTDDGARIDLESDRSERPVRIRLRDRCGVAGATPIAPRDEGVRTLHAVTSITPRVAGRLLDVFPGGCIVTEYDFDRGAHVPLFAELQQAVGLRSRLEVRQEVEDRFDIRLDG